MVMMKFFPILLTFCHQLVLQNDIIGMAASLIPYFVINRLSSSNVPELLFK